MTVFDEFWITYSYRLELMIYTAIQNIG